MSNWAGAAIFAGLLGTCVLALVGLAILEWVIERKDRDDG